MNKEQRSFIENHISAINGPNFNLQNYQGGESLFGSTINLKTFLKSDFYDKLKDELFCQKVQEEFRNQNFVKARIIDIANQNFLLKSELKSYYDDVFQNLIKQEIDKESFIDNTLEYIKDNIADSNLYRFTKTALRKILSKQYDFIFSNGFPTNLLNINSGVMTANAGDSAQFLFLARAILAGYNCSNVDVRSSRYDAVVDYNNVLLRLQIKGVSDNSISFKDRDRGGQGIDHTHERNRGQRITSNDCDIYVAVDKEVGICHLIPMNYVDGLDDENITSINLSTLDIYKENWGIIAEVAENKNPHQ